MKTTHIRNQSGCIIAIIDELDNGDKIIKSYQNTILGFYRKMSDMTYDRTNHPIAKGEQIGLLIYR